MLARAAALREDAAKVVEQRDETVALLTRELSLTRAEVCVACRAFMCACSGVDLDYSIYHAKILLYACNRGLRMPPGYHENWR